MQFSEWTLMPQSQQIGHGVQTCYHSHGYVYHYVLTSAAIFFLRSLSVGGRKKRKENERAI
jgi:hypothetical protein